MSMRKFYAMLTGARKQKRYEARLLSYLIRGGQIVEDDEDDDIWSRPSGDYDPFEGL